MLSVIFSWLAIFTIVSAIGGTTLRVFNAATGSQKSDLNIFSLFWIGCASIIAAVQIISLFHPINSLVFIGTFLWATTGVPELWSKFKSGLPKTQNHANLRRRFSLVAFGMFSFSLLIISANTVTASDWVSSYDTGLYHFNSMRWINEYAAIPGLGNLHSRLGLNSGFLLFSALFNNLWWTGHVAWITLGLLFITASVQWFWTILSPSPLHTRTQRIFCVATLPYLIQLCTANQASLYFDEACLVVQLVIFSELLRLIHTLSKRSNSPKADWDALPVRLFLLISSAALSFSFKPIGAITLLVLSILFSVVLFMNMRRFGKKLITTTKLGASIFSVCVIIITGHLSRNAVLTGWLLYPAPVGNIHSEWSMPENPLGRSHEWEMQTVAGQYHVIKGWARIPDMRYRKANTDGFSYWFPEWKKRVWHGVESHWLYLGIAFIVTSLLLELAVFRTLSRFGWQALPIALCLLNLFFWFTSAPDMRFGRGFFVIWAGLGVCAISAVLNRPSWLCYSMAAALCLYSAHGLSIKIKMSESVNLWAIGESHSFPTRVLTLDNEQSPPLQILVPQQGNRVGDSALPATPYPFDTLQLISPGNLESGFKHQLDTTDNALGK